MEFEIKPNQGAGAVDFGMHRDEVRHALKAEVKEFMKTPQSLVPTDAFRDLGVHIFYKPDFSVDAIEFWGNAVTKLQGQTILGQPVSHVLSWLRTVDPAVAVDNDNSMVRSRVLGLRLWVPDMDDDPDSPVKSVYISRS